MYQCVEEVESQVNRQANDAQRIRWKTKERKYADGFALEAHTNPALDYIYNEPY